MRKALFFLLHLYKERKEYKRENIIFLNTPEIIAPTSREGGVFSQDQQSTFLAPTGKWWEKWCTSELVHETFSERGFVSLQIKAVVLN